jgi:Lon protease-like protein
LTNFIPIFPLQIVVFPGEGLNLHIFEPRYRQLINDCFGEDRPFGIPSVVGNTLQDYGSLVKITEIKEVYEDGKMDIRVRGVKVFRILENTGQVPSKLYNGAIVNYPENVIEIANDNMQGIAEALQELHRLLHIEKNFAPADGRQLCSYDVAHHAGLTLEQEYEFLQLLREDQRQAYLKRHLQQVLPIVREMEALKERVKLNGHFRELKSLGL